MGSVAQLMIERVSAISIVSYQQTIYLHGASEVTGSIPVTYSYVWSSGMIPTLDIPMQSIECYL